MEYTLKDKLIITKDFIEELTEKSWLEIEQLQRQVANITDTDEGKKFKKLLNNLLTSYYVFVGGLENFNNISIDYEPIAETPIEEPTVEIEPALSYEPSEPTNSKLEISEPFEYFVDFDEPTGAPLTDEDIYN